MKEYDFRTKSEWAEEVDNINVIRKKAPWEMAHLLLWGIENLTNNKQEVSDLYDEMSEQLELARKTLQNYVSVARRFTPEEIHWRLEIGHHIVVTKMSDEVCDYWLARAEANAWSVQRLRAEIRSAAQTPSDEEGDDDNAQVIEAALRIMEQCHIEANVDEHLLSMRFPSGRTINLQANSTLTWSIT